MQRQEFDKQAQQLFKDWEVLNTAGIDTIAITERMGESVSAYVQDAMAMGTEIPAAMRPMLEAFAKNGHAARRERPRDHRPRRRGAVLSR